MVALALGADPPLPEMAAFHVQQSAEKMVKAMLILAGRNVPRSHDLTHLLRLLGPHPGLGDALATSLGDLTPWAISGRYPLPSDRQEPDAADVAASLGLLDRLRAALDAALAAST